MEWLRNLLNDNLLYHGVIAALIVIVMGGLSRTVRAILRWAAHRIFARTATVLDDRLVGVLLAHVRPLLVVIGLHIAVRELRKAVTVPDDTLSQILDYGDAILYIVVVILLVKIVLGMIRELIDWYLDRAVAAGSESLKSTVGPLTSKLAGILIGMVALIILLDRFGVNIGSLLVSLGVVSLAVALAAQDTLANMIAGFVILVDRPFRVGDRVELPSGQIGDVREIGMRSTRLVNFDNNLIIIPNAELVKGRITNYASPDAPMRLLLKFNVAYGTDVDKVRRLLLRTAGDAPDVLADPPPEVHLTAMNDSALEFTLVARAGSFKTRWDAESIIREGVYRKFREEGIEIPFPQRVVHLKGDA